MAMEGPAMDGNPSGWSQEDAESFAKQTIDEEAITEKRPLFRHLPPATPFPVDALGPLAEAASAIQARTQAPLAIAAQAVLATATLAVQAQRDVELPGAGQRPLTEIFISVAESGERKSSVDRLALAPVHEIEREWKQEIDAELRRYANAKAAWDTARDQAKRANKGNVGGIREALDATGPEPKPPSSPMLLISDPTPEALQMHLAEARPYVGVFTSEGGLFIGGVAFSEDYRMRTAALLNTTWDGDPIRRKRITTGTTFLSGRRCSAHIMMQRVVAETLFSCPIIVGTGLTSRMLLAAPDTTAGTRFFRVHPAGSAEALARYGDRIKEILRRPPITRPESPDILEPPAMRLSENGQSEWISFYDRCEAEVGPNGALSRIRAFGVKLPEHVGRLAAILTVYNDPDAMEVDLPAVKCAIDLGYYYANEMLRLHGAAAVSQQLRSAQRLLTWWQQQPDPSLYLAKIYQYGPSELRDAKSARRAVEVLEEHGWVRKLVPGPILDGAPRKDAWTLIR
jgi:Protein of unknown function (DUF3987)